MKKDGPSPEDLRAFLERCEKDLGLPREAVYDRLADEAGMSGKGVRKWFYSPESGSFRSCPYSVWRLWHLVLFREMNAETAPEWIVADEYIVHTTEPKFILKGDGQDFHIVAGKDAIPFSEAASWMRKAGEEFMKNNKTFS